MKNGENQQLLLDLFQAYYDARRNKRSTANALAFEINYEEKLATVLFVVDLGPDCYADSTRFPHGAWCKRGDFIIVRPNAGTRLLIHGREFRMINDDTVEAVVMDPRGIKRA